MPEYYDHFWGYGITYPDFCIQKSDGDSVYFAASLDCLDPLYEEPNAGFIAIRGEWNWAHKDIRPLWIENIGMVAGFMGAKDIGSAPWKLAGAAGLEAEIVLPKKENRRLWTGILSHDFVVLHFMVSHPKIVRDTFEPLATRIISSLTFNIPKNNADLTPQGIPLPPGYHGVDPKSVIDDIDDDTKWYAYDGVADIGAMQSFYVRELPANNWDIKEYVPYTKFSDLGFARYKVQKNEKILTLGLIPARADIVDGLQSHTRIVYKQSGE